MMAVNPDSVQHCKSALRWYANKIEYVEERLEPGEHPFEVDSCEVQKALNKYANAYLIHYQMTNQDAHQGLPTCILSIDEHCCLIHHLMEEKYRHWKDFGLSWNICQATFIQNKYANAYLIHYQMTNQDAHQGLPTCILSIDEHCCLIHHLMEEKYRHWKDFGLSWNICQATFIQQDTCHQLCLPHLCADSTHGPMDEGRNKTMLNIILMPGTHKDDSPTIVPINLMPPTKGHQRNTRSKLLGCSGTRVFSNAPWAL